MTRCSGLCQESPRRFYDQTTRQSTHGTIPKENSESFFVLNCYCFGQDGIEIAIIMKARKPGGTFHLTTSGLATLPYASIN